MFYLFDTTFRILPTFCRFYPRFADFTQSGVMVGVNVAHRGSLRQMQQGLWYNNNDQLISYRNNEPVIVTNYGNLFQFKFITFCFDDLIIHICEESYQEFTKDTRISVHFFK